MNKSLFFIFTFFLSLLTFTTASADIVYKPLAPIPGVFESSITLGKESSLAPYLNQIVRILIMVATGLAVLMVVKGGIQYSLTDSLTSKGEGRATIVRALQGLLLALASYMILNTLNPALLSGNIRGMNELEIDAVRAGDGFGSIEVANDGRINQNSNPLGGGFPSEVGDTINRAASQGNTTAEKIYRGALAASESKMQTCNVAGTDGGRKACAYAVDTIVANATGINITDSLSTRDLNNALGTSRNFSYVGSNISQAKRGDIIVSPTTGSSVGHTGIVSEDGGGGIISNSSKQGQVTENYDAASWVKRYETTLGLRTYIYRAVD